MQAALVLAVFAGAAAGFVNTLSGGGSYLVLPMLLALGLDTHGANATNRVGVLVSSFVGFRKIQRERPLPPPLLLRIAVPAILGAIAGAAVAVELDPRALDAAIGALLLAMLGLVIWRPERFLKKDSPVDGGLKPRSYLLLFLCGAYGGFIQAGVGLFLLAVLVLDVGFGLVRANAVKLLLVLLFTAPALLVFVAAGQVDWPIGLLVAAGQAVGSYAAARFAVKKQEAELWIRRLLIVVLPATTIKLWFFP